MKSITAAQAIRNAIDAERAAARFYTLLAESTSDDDTKEFLIDMAKQEVRHAESIEQMATSVVKEPLPKYTQGDAEVIETLPEWKYVDDIGLAQAFEVALAAERKAAMYYDAISDTFEGAAAEFFRRLAAQEEEHAVALEQRMK